MRASCLIVENFRSRGSCATDDLGIHVTSNGVHPSGDLRHRGCRWIRAHDLGTANGPIPRDPNNICDNTGFHDKRPPSLAVTRRRSSALRNPPRRKIYVVLPRQRVHARPVSHTACSCILASHRVVWVAGWTCLVWSVPPWRDLRRRAVFGSMWGSRSWSFRSSNGWPPYNIGSFAKKTLESFGLFGRIAAGL
jgi:hypothetical protein